MVINKIPLKTNFQFEKCSMAMAGHVWIKSSINNKYNQNKWDQNTAGICITITFPHQVRGLWLTNYNENNHQNTAMNGKTQL